MGVVLLAEHPCLKTALQVFRKFDAAFYGLRTMIVVWILMSLLRIKRIEHIRKKDNRVLGGILGLDRAPEVKTVRRKLYSLIKQGKALIWMDTLAKKRVEAYDGRVRTIQIDGHIVAYYGKEKLGTVYCPRTQRVCKGHTDNWVHIPGGGGALFVISSPFNEGLSGILDEVVKQACRISGEPTMNLILTAAGKARNSSNG